MTVVFQIHPVLMLIGFIILGGEGNRDVYRHLSLYFLFFSLLWHLIINALSIQIYSYHKLQIFPPGEAGEEKNTSSFTCYRAHTWYNWNLYRIQEPQ